MNRASASPNSADLTHAHFLAVPQPHAVGGNQTMRRRNSINGGQVNGRPLGINTNITAASFQNGFPSQSGLVPPPRSPTVASKAGIKASEMRRTKKAKFKCDQCGQDFTTNHNLKNHLAVHNGVKEHGCDACTKAFTTQSVLARHTKTCKAIPGNLEKRRSAGDARARVS